MASSGQQKTPDCTSRHRFVVTLINKSTDALLLFYRRINYSVKKDNATFFFVNI
jgi:hypothetical protein